MAGINRIIFVSKSGTAREPMAVGIMKDLILTRPVEIMARGMIVQFPEPMNQKAEAVLISNGIELPDFCSQQLVEEEITAGTLVLAMEERQKATLFEMFPNVKPWQIQVLPSMVGEELDIVNPYGGTVQTYGLCFESLRKSIKKLADMLNNDEIPWEEKEEESGEA